MKFKILMFAMFIALISFSCSVKINSTSSVSFIPKNYDFGSVIVNESATKNFQLRNVSGNTISVTSIEIVGDGNASYSILTGATVPFVLQSNQEHIIALKFSPKAEGEQNIKLVATYNNNRYTIEASITGYGSIEAILDVSPSSYDFGDVGIGATVEKDFIISNLGNLALTLEETSIDLSPNGNFYIVDGSISSSKVLNPGAKHVVTVGFSPTTLGAQDTILNIEHSLDGSPYKVQLNGNGSDKISVSPDQHNFGTVDVNTTTDPFTFTITNPTTANISLVSVSIVGTDSQSFNANPKGTMSKLIPGNGGSTTIDVTFRPTKAGSLNAVLKLQLTSGIINVNLSGVGVTNPIIEITPSSYSFGAVDVNTINTKVFEVKNTGNAFLVLSQIQLQDETDSSFSIIHGGTANTSIGPGLTHEIEIRFKPSSYGVKSANLRIDHNATNTSSPVFVAISGTCSAITFQPSLWDFGDVDINPPTAPKKIFTVTNNSSSSITIQNVSVSGTNASEFSSKPSGAGAWVVNPGGSYSIEATCKPTIEGALTAILQLDLSAGSPLMATLNANGVGNPIFKVQPSSIDFGTVEIKDSLIRKFTITNVGTGTLKITEIALIEDDGSFEIAAGGFSLGGPVINLAYGETHMVSVRFRPYTHGTKTAKVHIIQNGVISPLPYFDLNLRGNATGPEFDLIPMGTSYNYGHCVVNQTHSKVFYIRNSGDKNLIVSDIVVSGTAFSLEPMTTTFQLLPGHISVVKVNYKPNGVTMHQGSIKFTHNSIGSPYTVALSGYGFSGFAGYSENFDGSSAPTGWAATGDWQWGVQTSNGPTSTHTPTKCWATRLNNNYRDNQYCYLVSKTIDLSEAINPIAEYWLWLRTRNYYNIYKDGIWMEMSTDGGNTWTRNVNPSPSYNSTVSNNIPAYVGETTDGWEKITMDISAAAGKSNVMIAWYFYSDQYLNSYGAFVDSFRIYENGSVKPYNPTPVDNDINVKYTSSKITLRWESTKATSYDVYFGTTNPPTTLVANNTTDNFYGVSVTTGKKYYWKVIAETGGKEVYGPVWCFHTVTNMPKVFINEIDTIESTDWVEIYNADTKAAHIGGWQFSTYSDNNSYVDGTYVFRDYLVLQPGEAIVVHDNQAGNVDFKTEFNINWANSTSPGEVVLECPKYYNIGVDYMKFNTLNNHKPSDLNWYGSIISTSTSYSNFYRHSNIDTDNANDWTRRYRTADKGSKNPGQ